MTRFDQSTVVVCDGCGGPEGRTEISRWRKPRGCSREWSAPRRGAGIPPPLPGRIFVCDVVRWLTPPANFDAALRASAEAVSFTAALEQLPKTDFLRAWCALACAFPGLHSEGYEDAGSGWPRVLQRFAAEAWRRADAGELADEELHPCTAQWAGLYDRMHTHEDDETARRFQIAADYGARAEA
jgi:hypothetical protein